MVLDRLRQDSQLYRLLQDQHLRSNRQIQVYNKLKSAYEMCQEKVMSLQNEIKSYHETNQLLRGEIEGFKEVSSTHSAHVAK